MTAPVLPPPPLRAWSTDAVAPAQRLDYWVGAICEAFLEMDCSSREAPHFGGALKSVAVDTLSLNQVVASTQDVYRTPQAIARGRSHPYYLIAQRHAAWHVRQGGRLAQLRAGDAVLVDARQAYELHFPQGVECLSVQLPRAWVGQWLADAESAAPRVVPRDAGWGQTLSALLCQLAREPESGLAMPAALLSDQLGALLAAALEPQGPATGAAARALVQRLQDLLRAQLDQPGLQAAGVAQQAGVSLRTLHRAFAASGTTFADALRGLRLARARDLLGQPRLAALTVAEIGRRAGIGDASQFVRAFQRAYGSTPARWRRERLQERLHERPHEHLH